MKRLVRAWLLSVAFAPGCSCKGASEASAEPQPPAISADASAPSASPLPPIVMDIAKDLDSCALGHRGVLLDFGDASMRASVHPGSLAPGKDEVVEHEGATWLRARSRVVTASFFWPTQMSDSPDAPAYLEARVRGTSARGVAATIDGRSIGTLAIERGETRTVRARSVTPVALAPGAHELALRFIGGARAGDEALAEIDWVHVGVGDPSEPYAAPTKADVLVDSMLGGRSLRALSLRAPGFVRCSGWVPASATFEASLATAGGGEADVEARLLRDRRLPVVLGTAHVLGGGAGWTPWSLPVTGLDGDGALGSIEVVVKRAARGTRVLLGEPRLVAAGPVGTASQSGARGVLLVILGSIASATLAPWGGPHPVPELVRFASTGTTFSANRASSSLANAVVASMLTGLPPILHRLDDATVRLPDGPTTVQEAFRQGGVATAMFSANPTTGAAFGFARGWDTFTPRDPAEDGPSTAVFDDAAAWIEAHKGDRFFVVVHARGGHPPWEATPDELKTMPPDGYLGMVEPRRAAEALAKARKHPGRFREDDRVRAWALYDRAIAAHDAALGRLLASLHASGRDGDTAVVVTGDVAASEAPPVPFGDLESLDEPLLATPLVVRWPGAPFLAGRRVDAPSSPIDLARTILDVVGLEPPAAFQGVDLERLASGAVLPAQRPLAATRSGRISVRWGPYVLLGMRQRETRMCDLSLDPACIADVRATSPLALEAVRRWTVDTFANAYATPTSPPYAATPAVLDEAVVAALVRWGRISPAGEEP
ncbi:MAG TPA: sulfatase-like hydrolase/transferase [Polyangiaceae bacterium]|nr:sulfatase-like hydrolase/transferase [Polyangiaceae bacterium]